MRRVELVLGTTLLAAALLVGCGAKKDEAPEGIESIVVEELPIEEEEPEAEEESAEEEAQEEENHEGMVRSDLTNEWIDEELADQRPIAAMVDNELTALPHYGINQCDIVYEMMNSTENDRVTRLMAVMKDWGKIEQLGSIRSARPTNFMVAAEYNAILIHDGGPFYIDGYVAKDYTNNLSGGFARVPNGKATEFTEYVTAEAYKNPKTGKSYQGLIDRVKNSNYSTTYNSHYPGKHFAFAAEDQDLSAAPASQKAYDVTLPFPHNKSALKYNEETQTYDYSEYGKPHVDELDGKTTTFKNVILQSCSFVQLDENGYMVYEVCKSGEGYYLTNGYAIPITWSKAGEDKITEFKNKKTGETLQLNTGKTYIAIVPSDSWSSLSMK